MSPDQPTDLILLWHFHQPYYGLPHATRFELPWVRLHAAKSYLDMAAMLEGQPDIRVVANFSGSLLEQLMRYLDSGWRDLFWELTCRAPGDLTEAEHRFVLRYFFSLDWQTVLRRFPRYVELLDKRGTGEEPESFVRFSRAEMADLQLLFNLAWCGFTLREQDERVRELVRKGRGYNEQDKKVVLQVHLDAIGQVFARWRELVQEEQVEISVTPHYHPILPLLVDNQVARRSLPGHPLPGRFAYPEDASRQVGMALEQAEAVFGRRPVGLWPSEGGVSPEILPLVSGHGIQWLASDEFVLLQSDLDRPADRTLIYHPWQAGAPPVTLFFRDHELSDLLGFTYSRMEADRAARDFGERLAKATAGISAAKHPCVTVILDGENAWEHYPDDGRHFLSALYRHLAAASRVRTTTPKDRLQKVVATHRITRLHSGSWISANFRIWIGQREKNRAWEHLRRARKLYTERAAANAEETTLPEVEAYRFLLRAEGSDWMWWYGDDFQAVDKPLFDRLFRENLGAVYRALEAPEPSDLQEPIVSLAVDLVKAPRSLIHPTIDGHEHGYYDWVGAGSCCATGAAGSMHQSTQHVREILYGFDLERFYLRLRTGGRSLSEVGDDLRVEADFRQDSTGHHRTLVILVAGTGRMVCQLYQGEEGSDRRLVGTLPDAFLHECLECALPRGEAGFLPGSHWTMSLRLLQNEVELQRVPGSGELPIEVPDETFSERHWIV